MTFKLSVIVALAFTGSVIAAPSATQPASRTAASQPTTSAPPRFGPDFPRGFGPPGGGRPRFFASRMDDHLTEQQIKETEAFVSQHSPNHFKVYQQRLAEGRGHEMMQSMLVHGYLDLKALQNSDPDLFQMKLDQIDLQDKVFGIIAAARDGGKTIDNPKVKEEIRPFERQIVDIRKREARHRLNAMQKAIEAERQRLADLEDAGATDALADQDLDFNGRPMNLNMGRGPGQP